MNGLSIAQPQIRIPCKTQSFSKEKAPDSPPSSPETPKRRGETPRRFMGGFGLGGGFGLSVGGLGSGSKNFAGAPQRGTQSGTGSLARGGHASYSSEEDDDYDDDDFQKTSQVMSAFSMHLLSSRGEGTCSQKTLHYTFWCVCLADRLLADKRLFAVSPLI